MEKRMRILRNESTKERMRFFVLSKQGFSKTHQALTLAKDKLRQPNGWCRMNFALDRYGEDVEYTHPEAVGYCLTGSLWRGLAEILVWPDYPLFDDFSCPDDDPHNDFHLSEGDQHVIIKTLEKVTNRVAKYRTPQRSLDRTALRMGDYVMGLHDQIVMFNDDPETSKRKVLWVVNGAIQDIKLEAVVRN